MSQSESPRSWADFSDALIADYLIVHAQRAEEDGRYTCGLAMLEAARRLLKLEEMPTYQDYFANRPISF